ncbi:MAG: hypothetical protein ACK5C0_12330 [Candidatus Kapaibacterium sp.]|jgi:hypothetical protein
MNKKNLLPFFIFCFFTVELFAQDTDFALSDPLQPGKVMYPSFIGAEIAMGQSLQQGDLRAEFCDCLPFKDGRGLRFDIGGKWESYISNRLAYGFGFGFSYTTNSAAYQEVSDYQFIDNGNVIATVPVRTQQTMNTSFSAITFSPFIKIYPLKRLWFRIVPRIEYVVGSTQEQTLDLLQRKAVNRDGNEFELSFDPTDPKLADKKVTTTRATIQNSEFASLRALQLGLVPSIGFDFRIGNKVVFSPNVQLNIPLTSYSTQSESFKILAWQFGLDVKFRLGKSVIAPAKK